MVRQTLVARNKIKFRPQKPRNLVSEGVSDTPTRIPRPPLLTGAAASGTRLFLHGLHMVLVFYGLLGWLIPSEPWLIAHLIFIPGLIAVWRLNDGVCPLNNLEARLLTGTWRNADNTEEGGFLRAIVIRYLKLEPTQAQMDTVTYGLMAFVWLLSGLHLALLSSAA
jgi:hypothetical protein